MLALSGTQIQPMDAIGEIRPTPRAAPARTLKRALRWPVWALEAVPLFLIIGLFRLIGLDAASAVGSWIARRLAPLAPAHKTARRNLERALPRLSASEIDTILTGMWDNLGRVFAEYAHLRRFAGAANPRLAVEGIEHVRAALAKGKGALLVAGHLANWELLTVGTYEAGIRGAGIYRVINNPFIDRFIKRQRLTWPERQLLPKDDATTTGKLLRVLKQGRIVGLLIDQKYREGVAIPFFARDAMTAQGPAVLSLRSGAAIVPVAMERLGGSRFRVAYRPELQIAKSGDKTADQASILLAINGWLEGEVRARPTMWLWAHDRWMDAGS